MHFNTSYVTVQLSDENGYPFYPKISIHLMLRFNSKKNTSVNIISKFQYILCYGSTAIAGSNEQFLRVFQYILCYGSTGRGKTNWNKKGISIHLMLRFNGKTCDCSIILNFISIHLMLRFNCRFFFSRWVCGVISIHLMLRFNLCSFLDLR